MVHPLLGVMGMEKQQSFGSAAWSRKGKVTRRERFLAEMDAVIPWDRLVKLIAPHYPHSGKGRPPHDLERMLRIYFLQQWFNLSDPQAEDAIYDSESMRRFAPVELGDDKIPDQSTILRLRHRLEQAGLTEAIFEAVKDLLAERRVTLRAGTIVDATIISAPSSTKNATKRATAGSRSIGPAHGRGLAASTPSERSSSCGASRRCATGESQRTWRGGRRCLLSRICTPYVTGCCPGVEYVL